MSDVTRTVRNMPGNQAPAEIQKDTFMTNVVRARLKSNRIVRLRSINVLTHLPTVSNRELAHWPRRRMPSPTRSGKPASSRMGARSA